VANRAPRANKILSQGRTDTEDKPDHPRQSSREAYRTGKDEVTPRVLSDQWNRQQINHREVTNGIRRTVTVAGLSNTFVFNNLEPAYANKGDGEREFLVY
jgi:hypothetical protein